MQIEYGMRTALLYLLEGLLIFRAFGLDILASGHQQEDTSGSVKD